MIRRAAGLALLGLIVLLAGCAPSPITMEAGRPTDYLIQMVCVDQADQPIFADPVGCPDSRRKLRVGEPLPYHKVDVGGYQISDSFPIADANGVTVGVQSYFFTDAFDVDPAFPRQVHLDPARGGYNILGADRRFVFFRGTSDPGAYWQPWWTPDCQTRGWLLYPNDRAAFRSGEAASPATFAPGCATWIRTNASTVEWDFVPAQAYVVDATEAPSTRRLDSFVVRHFAGGYGAMEANWFTREYGVTRWEAWVEGSGRTPDFLKIRCPGVDYDARFHGKAFTMIDCRNWTILVRPEGGAWDPDGASALDPAIRTFAVDPLYTGRNWLLNTHVGGPYEPRGSFSCDGRAWRVVPTSSSLVLGLVDTPPWNGNGNCVRTIQANGVPSGSYAQTIGAPPQGNYRYGGVLFAPDLAEGQSALAEIRITQRDGQDRMLSERRLTTDLIAGHRTFEGMVQVSPDARRLTFEVSPLTPNVRVAVTGAFIAQ